MCWEGRPLYQCDTARPTDIVTADNPAESLLRGGIMTVTAIVGGRIVPVGAEPIESGILLIEDGRISALGGPDLPVPEGAEIVDAAGKWVLPGFIEAHG